VENRLKARRTIREVQTQYGPIKCKVAEINSDIINISPEYEDCTRVTLEEKISLKEVMDAAKAAALAVRAW